MNLKNPFKKVKHRIFVVLLIKGVVLTFFGIAVTFFVFFIQYKSGLNLRLQNINQNKTLFVKNYINEKIGDSQIIANSISTRDIISNHNIIRNTIESDLVSDSGLDAEKNFLYEYVKTHNLKNIYILSDKGEIVWSTNDLEKVGTNYDSEKSDIPIFKIYNATLKKNDSVVFNPLNVNSLKTDIFYVGTPVFDLENQEVVLGVIVMEANLKLINKFVVDKTGMQDVGENYIVDRNLSLSTSLINNSGKTIEKLDSKEIRECFKTKNTNIAKQKLFKFKDYQHNEVVGIYQYLPEIDWCLVVQIDNNEAYKSLHDLNIAIAIIGLVILLVVIITSNSLGSSLARPIEKLTNGVRVFERGKLDYNVIIDSEDEIGQLSQAFHRLATSLHKSKLELEKKSAAKDVSIEEQRNSLEMQKKAILNILEDVEGERDKSKMIAKDLEKFKLAVDDASDHIVITDSQGIIVYANDAVEEITGFSKEEIMGKKVGTKDNWGGYMGIQFYEKLWNTIIDSKKVFNGEIQNKRKNGEEYIVDASISPIMDDNDNVIFMVGIERDVTHEKEVDKAKTEFVSLASHQLRTPLTAISWYTEMLLAGDAGKLNKEQKNYLHEVYNGNKRMVDLVNSLLNVSRLELGTFIVEPEPVNIRELVDTISYEFKSDIFEKSIDLKKDYDKRIPKIIQLDIKLFSIIVQNLLSNAIKYTKVDGKVSLNLGIMENNFTIVVSDTGMGIPRRQQKNIFSKLFRADNVREADTEGTGLGLYIVKAIIDQTGGTIKFDSKEGTGTTFTVTMPLTGMKKRAGKKKLN